MRQHKRCAGIDSAQVLEACSFAKLMVTTELPLSSPTWDIAADVRNEDT
jgi:hypothetical protein